MRMLARREKINMIVSGQQILPHKRSIVPCSKFQIVVCSKLHEDKIPQDFPYENLVDAGEEGGDAPDLI